MYLILNIIFVIISFSYSISVLKMSKIISLGGLKGGTGKTSIVIHIANVLIKFGYTVKLFDLDENTKNLSSWYLFNEKNKNMSCEQLFNSSQQAAVKIKECTQDFILLDCPGMLGKELRMALSISDVFIAPLEPSQFSIETMPKMEKLIESVEFINSKLLHYYLISRATTNIFVTKNQVFSELIKEGGYPLLKNFFLERGIYKKSVDTAISIYDSVPLYNQNSSIKPTSNLSSDQKAIIEIEELTKEIINNINKNQPTQ